MSIDVGTDRKGTALRMLVYQALKAYGTDALFPFLRDTDPIVRTAAARALQTRGGAAVFEHAKALARSRREADRETAAFIMGQLGSPAQPFRSESLPFLERLCSDASASVREAALASLGHLQARELVTLVKQLKQDDAESVRKMARFVERQLKTA